MTTAVELYARTAAYLQHVRRSERGQGTIEYIGILFIVAAICAAVVAFVPTGAGTTIGGAIVNAIASAISKVMGS